jgi:hypothetical protein
MFFRLLTELAVVLGVVSVVAQSRRTHELRDMLSPAFVGTMALLISIALVGPLLSLTILRSKRPHAPVKHLIVLLAVAALGAGTLTWASTTRRQCGPDACTCQKPEQRPIAAAGQ